MRDVGGYCIFCIMCNVWMHKMHIGVMDSLSYVVDFTCSVLNGNLTVKSSMENIYTANESLQCIDKILLPNVI